MCYRTAQLGERSSGTAADSAISRPIRNARIEIPNELALIRRKGKVVLDFVPDRADAMAQSSWALIMPHRTVMSLPIVVKQRLMEGTLLLLPGHCQVRTRKTSNTRVYVLPVTDDQSIIVTLTLG